MVTNDEIVTLIQKAQETLPPEQQRPFVERVSGRVGGFLRDHQKALLGAGIGWVVGEIVDQLPLVGTLTGDNASTVGALIGAWIGHAKDVKDRETREKIGQIVADELAKARNPT